jgi:hypothetical protein
MKKNAELNIIFGFSLVLVPLLIGATLRSPKDSDNQVKSQPQPQPQPQPLIALSVPFVTIATNFDLFFFSATATDQKGLTSDYSNEAIFTNYWSNYLSSVSLAWDASITTNQISNYTVWQGTQSQAYVKSAKAGTNLTLKWQLVPPPLTNLVVNVTTTGTNLYRATTLKGPWTKLNTTNYFTTNPPASYLFRSKGKSGNKVFIKASYQ